MEKFSLEPNGYNKEEVNQFVGDVIKQTENIVKKCKAQQAEIDKLKNQLEHYKDAETNLKKTIIQAEKASDRLKEMAKEEAIMIVNDAKNNASRIVNEALLKADKIETKRDILEKNLQVFKRKLKLVVEQQMAVVEEIDTLEIIE